MRSLLALISILLIIPALVSAQMGTELTCYSTGTFADISCVIGNGFLGLFGNPIMLTIFTILIGVILSWRFKLPLELTAVFMFALVYIAVLVFAETWIKYAVTILLAVGVGYGIYKFLRR